MKLFTLLLLLPVLLFSCKSKNENSIRIGTLGDSTSVRISQGGESNIIIIDDTSFDAFFKDSSNIHIDTIYKK